MLYIAKTIPVLDPACDLGRDFNQQLEALWFAKGLDLQAKVFLIILERIQATHE